MEGLGYILEICGVIFYTGFGIITWSFWEDTLLKKRYHLFWYLVFLPVTLTMSLYKWLYNFMKKDL